MEPVYLGWLIKSPPEKRLWRAKWRRRWFILRQSGQIPGQYLLEYYTDSTCKKRKGKIDLDQCNQIDSGLTFESRKWNYQFMFDIRTPKRIYLLVAETESEMNKWVECICQVCGLKIESEEDQPPVASSIQLAVNQSLTTNGLTKSPKKIEIDTYESQSSQYIPISECVSGKTFNENSLSYGFVCKDFLHDRQPLFSNVTPVKDCKISGEVYDYPRMLNIEKFEDSLSSSLFTNTLEIDQYSSSSSSIPESKENNLSPKVNWDTFPGALSVQGLYEIDTIQPEESRKTCELYKNVSLCQDFVLEKEKLIPPRPPKPPHLIETNYENCFSKLIPAPSLMTTPSNSYDVPNSEALERTVILPALHDGNLDEVFDFTCPPQDDNLDAKPPPPANVFPRKHAYINASAEYLHDDVFSFDNCTAGESYLNMELQRKESDIYTDMAGEVLSPLPIYTNLTSRNCLLPPVHRDLKPLRKDSTSNNGSCSNVVSSNTLKKSLSPGEEVIPPHVNRELKPVRTQEDKRSKHIISHLPVCQIKHSNTKRSFCKPRVFPSPISDDSTSSSQVLLPNSKPQVHSSSEDDQSSSGGSRRNSTNDELRVETCVFNFATLSNRRGSEIQYLDLDLESDFLLTPKSPERSFTSTVYKTVDFVKTKAFNETRQNVEEIYRKSQN